MKSIEQVLLLDIVRAVRGTEPGSQTYCDSEHGVRFLRVGDISGKVDSPVFTNSEKIALVKKDDILLALDGSPGYVAKGFEGAISSGIRKMEVISNDLSPSYLFYALKSSDVQKVIKQHTRGVTIAHASTALPHIKIPLPPLPEQDRIVRLLDETEHVRAARLRANERMGQFVPALFIDMFGDPSTNPKKWDVVLTEKLLSQAKAGTKCGPFGSALKKHEYVASGVPVWGIDNVLANKFVEEGSLFITKTKFEELSSYIVDYGDILISRAGTVGRMCVAYPKQYPSIIGTNLIRLSFDKSQVVSEYFTAMATHFSSSIGNLRANADEAAYSFVNTKTLKLLNIPLPPLALQQEFASRVAEARAVDELQRKSAERINALQQSMLARAFTGEL